MSKVYKIEFDMANDANSTFTENSFIRFSKDLEGTQVIADPCHAKGKRMQSLLQ